MNADSAQCKLHKKEKTHFKQELVQTVHTKVAQNECITSVSSKFTFSKKELSCVINCNDVE